MQKIVLHIGHLKTGSSYLQSCLALSRDKLLELDIDYPLHKSFSRAAAGRISSGNGKRFLDSLPNIGDPSKKIIFSNESLFHSLLEEEYDAFLEFLDNKNYSSEVILYTRNLFDHAFSRWGQMVKRGKCFDDLDTYLIKNPCGPHPYILKWIQLSNKFKFKLIIRNYSFHKDNLANIFFHDLTGIENFAFKSPSQASVNRSLTLNEINFQRVLNKLDFDGNSVPLSDLLVNELPNLKPGLLKCHSDTYDSVVNSNFQVFESINKYLGLSEPLRIEDRDEVSFGDNDLGVQALSNEQIDIISEYISTRLLSNAEIDNIREIAIKLSNSKAGLVDSIQLIKLVQKYMPRDKLTKTLLNKWEAKIDRLQKLKSSIKKIFRV